MCHHPFMPIISLWKNILWVNRVKVVLFTGYRLLFTLRPYFFFLLQIFWSTLYIHVAEPLSTEIICIYFKQCASTKQTNCLWKVWLCSIWNLMLTLTILGCSTQWNLMVVYWESIHFNTMQYYRGLLYALPMVWKKLGLVSEHIKSYLQAFRKYRSGCNTFFFSFP